MDPDAVIVFNKAELAKSIHEEAHAGPGGADPGGNCCRTEVIERENAASSACSWGRCLPGGREVSPAAEVKTANILRTEIPGSLLDNYRSRT
jgi:hypothetical protein